MKFHEPMTGMFTSSKTMILDFAKIPENLPTTENIKLYFAELIKAGSDPKLPANRQRFNDIMLDSTGYRYLVSQYGEDRSAMLAGSSIAKEGRVLHMGLDIFSRDQEEIFSPCDGEIVRADHEIGDHGWGNYIIIRPDNSDFYIFLGHLRKDLPALGRVKAGQKIAQLGDYHGFENGGWSRHLHLQICRKLPTLGETPLGYSSKAEFEKNSGLYPDPLIYFTNWKIV